MFTIAIVHVHHWPGRFTGGLPGVRAVSNWTNIKEKSSVKNPDARARRLDRVFGHARTIFADPI